MRMQATTKVGVDTYRLPASVSGWPAAGRLQAGRDSSASGWLL
jgi:hypothetical protein